MVAVCKKKTQEELITPRHLFSAGQKRNKKKWGGVERERDQSGQAHICWHMQALHRERAIGGGNCMSNRNPHLTYLDGKVCSSGTSFSDGMPRGFVRVIILLLMHIYDNVQVVPLDLETHHIQTPDQGEGRI